MCILIAIVVTIVIFPKIIDCLFNNSSIFSLSFIEASDILSYVGIIVSTVIAVYTIRLSIKQFDLSKENLIIPINKSLYFFDYNKQRSFIFPEPILTSEKYNELEYFGIDQYNLIEFKNISENTARDFNLIIDYKSGEYYEEILSQLHISPKLANGFKSTFENDKYLNNGIFSYNNTKKLSLPTNLAGCLKILALSINEDYKNRNFFIGNKNIKLAKVIITSIDFLGNRKEMIFNLCISLSTSLKLGEVEDNEKYDVMILINFMDELNLLE